MTELVGKIVVLEGDGEFGFEIVGESHRQAALELLAGGRSENGADFETHALVLPDDKNRYDVNAVVVLIDSEIVGYLDKANAKRWREVLFSTGVKAAMVPAKICGGWVKNNGDTGNFGVKLDVTYPLTVTATN